MDQKAAICNSQQMHSDESGSNSSHQYLFPKQCDSQTIGQNRHNESFTSEAPSVATNASSLQLTGANMQPASPRQQVNVHQTFRPTPLRVDSNSKSWELPTLYEQHQTAPETVGNKQQTPPTPPDKDSDSGCSADMSNTTDCTKNSQEVAKLHSAAGHWDLTRTNMNSPKRAVPPKLPYSGSPTGRNMNRSFGEGTPYEANYRDMYQTFQSSQGPVGVSSPRDTHGQNHFTFGHGGAQRGVIMEDNEHYEMNV